MRLIVHQLAYLTRFHEFASDLSAYDKAVTACEVALLATGETK